MISAQPLSGLGGIAAVEIVVYTRILKPMALLVPSPAATASSLDAV
jgi:hypothetical protein